MLVKVENYNSNCTELGEYLIHRVNYEVLFNEATIDKHACTAILGKNL